MLHWKRYMCINIALGDLLYIYICVYVCVCVLLFILMMHTESITITHKSLATVSLHIVSRKRRRQCTLKIRSDRKVFPSSSIGVLYIFWLSCLGPLVLLLANKQFGFPIFRFWAYLMKVIPEMRRSHSMWYLRFYEN